MLIVHCEEDELVPCEMSKKHAQINPNLIRLETFENAGHGMSFILGMDRYLKLEHEFWNYCIDTYKNLNK